MKEYNMTKEFKNYLDLLNEFQDKALKPDEQLTEEQFDETFLAFLNNKTLETLQVEPESRDPQLSRKKLDMSYYSFKPGTLLIDDGNQTQKTSSREPLMVGHAVVVAEENTQIIEVQEGDTDQVMKSNLEDWMNQVIQRGGTIYEVWPHKGLGTHKEDWKDANDETGKKAARDAEKKLGEPCDHSKMNKHSNDISCSSQFCWRIWNDLKYDLDFKYKTWVTPIDLTKGKCSKIQQQITPSNAKYQKIIARTEPI